MSKINKFIVNSCKIIHKFKKRVFSLLFVYFSAYFLVYCIHLFQSLHHFWVVDQVVFPTFIALILHIHFSLSHVGFFWMMWEKLLKKTRFTSGCDFDNNQVVFTGHHVAVS